MTQSLSILMSDALPLLLPVLAGLLIGLLFWFRQRRSRLAKSKVTAGENHPAIPRRVYKLSEFRQSKLAFTESQAAVKKKPVPLSPGTYHIPPDLWDV